MSNTNENTFVLNIQPAGEMICEAVTTRTINSNLKTLSSSEQYQFSSIHNWHEAVQSMLIDMHFLKN